MRTIDKSTVRELFVDAQACEQAVAAFSRVSERIREMNTSVVVVDDPDAPVFAGRALAAMAAGRSCALLPPQINDQDRAKLSSKWTGESTVPDGAVLIATGGTGGRLKLAVHTRQNLRAAAFGLRQFFDLQELNSVCGLPLWHVSGFMQLVRALETGGSIRFVNTKNTVPPQPFDGKPWLLSLVPTQLHRLLEKGWGEQTFADCRAVMVGGGPCRLELLQQARERGVPVVPVYGMTETAAVCAALDVDRPIDHAFWLQALPGVRFRAEGAQLSVAAPSLFKGYYPGQTNAPAWHVTGDLGEVDAQGRVRVTGRADRIINTGGEKVDPHRVEEALLYTGLASEALVLGVPNDEWGEVVAALYVPGCDSVSTEQLQARLRKTLAAFEIPRRMVAVQELPVDERGKVDRPSAMRLLGTP